MTTHLPAIVGLALLVACLGVGCQRAMVEAPNPLPIATEEYDRMYDATAVVLRDHGFEVARQDYRFGHINTQPKDAPTAVEVWHADNTTSQQAWQATLDHVRRIAIVQLDPIEHADDMDEAARSGLGDYTLHVEVLMERRVQPTRRLTGGSSRNVFSSLSGVPEEWRRRGISNNYWEPIGRDPHMEARLMRDIVAEAMGVR